MGIAVTNSSTIRAGFVHIAKSVFTITIHCNVESSTFTPNRIYRQLVTGHWTGTICWGFAPVVHMLVAIRLHITCRQCADNLSCDAHKDRMIQSGKLAEHCEGWILNPIQLQASPCLFKLEKSTGKLRPDPETCAVSPAWPGNQHLNLQTLVQHTIDMLNLNCDRLSEARRRIIWDIESNKKKQRLRGYSPEQGLRNLAEHFLRKEWPEFFTTIRLCLGRSAEIYLAAAHYRG